MLKIDDNLGAVEVGAGEPFLLQVAFRDGDNDPVDMSKRQFVLTLCQADRTVIEAINGVADTDGTGPFVRFERDGSFTDGYYGVNGVLLELSEEYSNGRRVLATGSLKIGFTAASVPNNPAFGIGAVATRMTIANVDTPNKKLAYAQTEVAYAGQSQAQAPSVTTKPSIQSDGTPTAGETMTGVAGTYTNGTVQSNKWLLDGNVIASNTPTVQPSNAGELVYRETVANSAGTTIQANSDPLTIEEVQSSTAFTMGDASFANYQQFARTTKTGGYANKGTATIPAWPIVVTTSGPLYARLIAKNDPNKANGTVVQAPWKLADYISTAADNIDIVNCGCGSAWFEVQLAGSANGPWQSAPNPVSLGVGVAIFGTGQSIIGAMASTGGAANYAAAGVAPNPYVSSYRTTMNDNNYSPPVWAHGSDVGVGFSVLGDRLQTALGTNVIIAAHSHGGINAPNLLKNVDGSNGSDFAYVTAIMNGIKAWEYTWWFQGHTDSSQGMGGRSYQCYLRWYYGYAAYKNFWGKNTRSITMGIPNANGWGTDAQKNEIRSAQYKWAKSTEAAAVCLDGNFYANTYALEQYDQIHPNAVGCKRLGNLAADALLNSSDIAAGDDALGALIPSVFSTPDAATYTDVGKFTAAALNGGSVKLDNSPPIGPITLGAWVNKSTNTGGGILFSLNNYFYLQQNGNGFILSSGNGYQQTGGTKVQDGAQHYVSVEINAHPYDQTKSATATVYVDGVAIPGCTDVAVGGPTGGEANIRRYFQGGYVNDPAVYSEFTIYNRLNVPVPAGKVVGTETAIFAATALNGSTASIV